MLCPKCGASLSGDERFCVKCGTKTNFTDAAPLTNEEILKDIPDASPSSDLEASDQAIIDQVNDTQHITPDLFDLNLKDGETLGPPFLKGDDIDQTLFNLSPNSNKKKTVRIFLSVLLILVLIGGIGGVGYRFYKLKKMPSATLDSPTYSLNEGSYNSEQTVAINKPEGKNVSVYFTLDGSAPTDKSSLYEKAIPLQNTTTLKSIAIDKKGNTSAVKSATYVIGTAPTDKIDTAPQPTAIKDEKGSTTFANEKELMEAISGQWSDGKGNLIYFGSVFKITHDCPIQYKDRMDGMTGTYGIMGTNGTTLDIQIYNQKEGGITIDKKILVDAGPKGDGVITIWNRPWTYISDRSIF
ncbi:MAG: chitobiase/beta-hexosaminidase C-terminal domain-containing protein [Eubacterium sp.]